MEIVRIKTSLLEQNTGQLPGLPANPRTWTQSDIDRIARSLKETPELFEMRPCIVKDHGGRYVILGGNLRFAGAKKNGAEEVPCIVVPEDLPEAKLKEIVIKDNGAFGAWDFDALANEWDDLSLVEWGVPAWDQQSEGEGIEENTAEEDNFDEDKEEIHVICQQGDIWQLGDHRLMCGDSTSAGQVALLMNGSEADLLLTDPPYNVEYVGAKNRMLDHLGRPKLKNEEIENDVMSTEDYGDFLSYCFKVAEHNMKAGAAFYVWYPSLFHTIVERAVSSSGLLFKQQIIWNKNTFVLGWNDYKFKHEPCLYGWKDGAPHYFFDSRRESTVIEDRLGNIKTMKKSELLKLLEDILADKGATTVINVDKPPKSAEHPTMKPVKLIGYIMRNSTRRGDAVLDIFGGSGTTLIAAEQLGRKCYMMELDPHYCDVIIARWEKLTGKKAVRIEPAA